MERPFKAPLALPRGPEHYWKIANACQDGFTLGELAGCTNGIAYTTVKHWVSRMRGAGYLKCVGTRPKMAGGTANVYAVAKKSRQAPVIRRDDFTGARGKIQQNLWNAMRTLPQFTIRELAYAASTENLAIKRRTAEEYVRRLIGADVVEVLTPYAKARPGRTGAREGVYRLSPRANSGPRAPRVFNATIVFDCNKQKIVGEAEVRE